MGKRPLVTVTIAFLGGLFLGEVFSYFPVTLSILFLSFLFIETLFWKGRLLSLPLFIVALLGFVLYQTTSTSHSPEDLRWYLDQAPVRLIAEIDGPLQHRPKAVVLRMKGIAVLSERGFSPVEGKFRLTIYQNEIPFRYGDQLEMTVRLRTPTQFQNSGAFQYADYRERGGWRGSATLPNDDHIRKVGEGGLGVLRLLYGWREEIRIRILNSVEGPPAALLMALVIGETGYLTDPVREAFSDSGTAHILAVSGSHLAFVSLLVFGLTRWLILRMPEPILLRISLWKIPAQWASLLTGMAVSVYAFLAGGRIGTLRALMMILIYLSSIWIGRGSDTKSSLSLAALLILFAQPQALFELSFQLSFLAVLAILLVMAWWEEAFPSALNDVYDEVLSPKKNRLIRTGGLILLSTLGATLGTAPLTLYYFHQFSWVGFLANLIIVPFAGWIMVPFGLLSALFSFFLEKGFIFSFFHHWIGSLYYQGAAFFSNFPGAGQHFSSPPILSLFLFYGLLFTGLIRAASWRTLLCLVSAFFLFFLGWGGMRLAPEKLRVTFLDVGQGDATLIEFPKGRTMLIDGGPRRAGRSAIAPALWERGIRKIDYLVGSHPQMDHVGGFAYLLRKFQIGEVWTDGIERKASFIREISALIKEKKVNSRTISGDDLPMEIDGCRIFFLNPSGEKVFRKGDNLNDYSIVFRLSCPTLGREGLSFLLTGDIEGAVEQDLVESGHELKSTFLKVPHHGSHSSSTHPFISAVSPRAAMISVGSRNRYGHPHQKIISRYADQDIQVYRTDEDGALVVEAKRSHAGGLQDVKVQTYRARVLKKISWRDSPGRQEWRNLRKLLILPFLS
ncbi:MAG: DNA internalization-related competence protein ComEC/Rec2 [Nitrospiria bacterium]